MEGSLRGRDVALQEGLHAAHDLGVGVRDLLDHYREAASGPFPHCALLQTGRTVPQKGHRPSRDIDGRLIEACGLETWQGVEPGAEVIEILLVPHAGEAEVRAHLRKRVVPECAYGGKSLCPTHTGRICRAAS